jgi:hypothetical protein
MASASLGSAASSQNITLPNIPELFESASERALLLDTVIPQVPPKTIGAHKDGSSNPMMEALKSTAHQTFTDKGAPAYDSTLSATLDAFQALAPHAKGSNIYEHLDKAWAEDSNLTLRMIWNARSLHDGKARPLSLCPRSRADDCLIER